MVPQDFFAISTPVWETQSSVFGTKEKCGLQAREELSELWREVPNPGPWWSVLMQMRTPNLGSLVGPKSTSLIGQNGAALIGQ